MDINSSRGERPRCTSCIDHPGWSTPDETQRRDPLDVCPDCLGSGIFQGGFRVVSDKHSGHGLPVGAVVTPTDAPEWDAGSNDWYTQGGDGDEVAIDPRDIEENR